jgi:hypothetical protein
MKSLDTFLEFFHDGRESEYNKILTAFGSTRNFLKLLLKYKVELYNVDIAYIPASEFKEDNGLFKFIADNGFLDDVEYDNLDDTLKNYYLIYLIDKNDNDGLKFICDYVFSDVQIRDTGYWLRLSDREELAEFFDNGGRDYSASNLAKTVFAEDGTIYEYYWDSTDDVYRDVIEELNEKNTQSLAEYILENVGNRDLSTEDFGSDFFQELADTDGRDGLFQITSDNVISLIKDEEAMNELLDTDLDELKSNLNSLHNNAYNGAYGDMLWNKVMEGLDEYFSSPIDEVAVKIGEKTRYTPYIKIRDFYSNVMTFLNEYRGYSDTLDYYGGYTEMMSQLFNDGTYEQIDFRVYDYPDSSEVNLQINDLFGDYLY